MIRQRKKHGLQNKLWLILIIECIKCSLSVSMFKIPVPVKVYIFGWTSECSLQFFSISNTSVSWMFLLGWGCSLHWQLFCTDKQSSHFRVILHAAASQRSGDVINKTKPHCDHCCLGSLFMLSLLLLWMRAAALVVLVYTWTCLHQSVLSWCWETAVIVREQILHISTEIHV